MVSFKKAISLISLAQIIILIVIVTSFDLNSKTPNMPKIHEIKGPFTEQEYLEMHMEAEKVVQFIKENSDIILQGTNMKNETETNSMKLHLD